MAASCCSSRRAPIALEAPAGAPTSCLRVAFANRAFCRLECARGRVGEQTGWRPTVEVLIYRRRSLPPSLLPSAASGDALPGPPLVCVFPHKRTGGHLGSNTTLAAASSAAAFLKFALLPLLHVHFSSLHLFTPHFGFSIYKASDLPDPARNNSAGASLSV